MSNDKPIDSSNNTNTSSNDVISITFRIKKSELPVFQNAAEFMHRDPSVRLRAPSVAAFAKMATYVTLNKFYEYHPDEARRFPEVFGTSNSGNGVA